MSEVKNFYYVLSGGGGGEINFFIRIEIQVLFLILVIHRSRLIDKNQKIKDNLKKGVSADKMIF